MTIVSQLDSPVLQERLAALEQLCGLERAGKLDPAAKIGPVLPSYDHVHTTASYGHAAPGVHSAARMAWAAHEARAYSILSVEHESLEHMDEMARAVEIVNRGVAQPLKLVLAVEFKTLIVLDDEVSRRFSGLILKAWGQGEAAWVVGVGARPGAELTRLVRQFQDAKRVRAEQLLAKLNAHLGLKPALKLADVLTPEGNITDRLLSLAVAKVKWPDADDATLAKHGSVVRKMCNPGGPAYAPYPAGLPGYQELIQTVARLGMVPTFTAQLRGAALDEMMPALLAWGIGGLDVAGIEPYEPDAAQEIAHYIALAGRHGLAFVGGSDYRGTGTGWLQHAPWMDHPLVRATIDRLACA
ncbi:MAG: hypothetical protein HZA91_17315 [Verrucomicrobia bacterium]|nr:hypothetical protein [Verrucomicrobiota bacterium]